MAKPLFDIFIDADFDQLQIATDEMMDDGKTQIESDSVKNQIIPGLPVLEESSGPTNETSVSPPNVPSLNNSSKPKEENPFTDLSEDHPYYKDIIKLYKSGVIEGFGNKTFKADANLQRSEFVKIALGATNCLDCTQPTDPQKTKYNQAPFPDVNLPAWYYYCISIAKELGMITGYGDGFFKP